MIIVLNFAVRREVCSSKRSQLYHKNQKGSAYQMQLYVIKRLALWEIVVVACGEQAWFMPSYYSLCRQEMLILSGIHECRTCNHLCLARSAEQALLWYIHYDQYADLCSREKSYHHELLGKSEQLLLDASSRDQAFQRSKAPWSSSLRRSIRAYLGTHPWYWRSSSRSHTWLRKRLSSPSLSL